MADKLAYLGNALTERTNAVADAYGYERVRVMREATLAGNLHSSRMFLLLGEGAFTAFDKHATDAAQFAYNVMETNEGEVANQVTHALKRMEESVGQALTRDFKENSYAEILVKAKDKLKARRERIVEDFIHGMMGSNKLAKDPVISVVQHQTGSPGGVQQVGFGNFSQTAFTKQQNALVRAIDEALASPEYKALGQPQKDAFKDIADTVKDESAKPKPDEGKLKRWGSRLVDLAKELGMKAATDSLANVLTDIFTG